MKLKTATTFAIFGAALIVLIVAYYCYQNFAAASSASDMLKYAVTTLIQLIGWIGILIFFIVLRKNQK